MKEDLHLRQVENQIIESKGYEELLMLIDLDDLHLNYINPVVENFTGIKADFILQSPGIFQEKIIHPEDKERYIKHLQSFSNNQKDEKEIIIRLKKEEDSWTRFCFNDRLYTCNPNNEKKALLSRGKYIPEQISSEEKANNLCEEVAQAYSPSFQYQRLLDSIDEAYCIIEVIFNKNGEAVDYLFLETNSAYENKMNLKDVEGKTVKELLPEQEDHWFNLYGKIATTGESLRFREKEKQADGNWYSCYAFRLGKDKSRQIAVLFSEITARKKAEDKLLKSKEQLEIKAYHRQKELEQTARLLQAVFDTTNLAIAVYKPLYDDKGGIKDFEFLRVNKVLQEYYLKDDRDLIGKTYRETTKYGVEMGIFDGFKNVISTGEIMDKEYFYGRDEYNNWFRVIARKQGEFLITSIEDITLRKRETQQMEEAVKFNKQLVQTSPDTIFIINLDKYNVRYINKDMLTRAGMTKERIEGMSLPEVLPYLHPRDREKLVQFHKKILKSGDDDIHDAEFRVKTSASNWEWFNARGKIFSRKEENLVEEYVLLVRNITEQKNTQLALINAEKLSIQGEVARTFAHELRNPLASIRMATDVIKHKIEKADREQMDNYLEILSRSTRTLNDLVSNLLNASNYSALKLEKTDLAECVEHSLEQAADRIYLTGISLIKKFNDGPYYILADKEKLKIALLNIIVNASEATTPQEGIIELKIEKHKTDFLLSISDNGHGLEQEQIDRLFDAFYTNKSTGTGIGLTSVKNILREHDAHITVESVPKKGTTFKILF
ncbi:MAG TPA: PAS domain-containing sensor histidine kinase, partial [Gillisia sp.]|nr:PAS domain-containing sensor histidine kinase [Gillisia sp.]